MKKTTITLILGLFLTSFVFGQSHLPDLSAKKQKAGKKATAVTCNAAQKKANHIKKQSKVNPDPSPVPEMPPSNDDACNAIMIIVNDPAISGTNGTATVELNEVVPPDGTSCTTYDGWCEGPSQTDNTVWYKFVVPAGGGVEISTCAGPNSFDTQIALWQATDCGDFSTYTFLSGNDDGINCATDYTSTLIDTGLTAGDTLLIQLDGYLGDTGTFEITVIAVSSPANDLPCNAIAVAVGGSAGTFTNMLATADANESNITPPGGDCASNAGWCDLEGPSIDNSVWFTFTAPNSGAVSISTCNSASPFDTQVALYDVGNCNDYSTFTFVGGNDDGDTSICPTSWDFFTSLLQVCGLTPGSTYYILVDGYTGAFGQFDLTIDSASTSLGIIAGANTAPECPTGSNGTAAIDITVGIGPFSYLWSNGYIGSTLIAPAGTYTVTVTDQCTATVTSQVVIPASSSTLTINSDSIQHLCDTNGIVLTASANGGIPNETTLSFFGFELGNGNIIRFDESNTTSPIIISGGITQAFYAGDLTPSGYYAIDNNNSELYQVELSSGTLSKIGAIALNPGHNWTGMTWDASNSTLYALSSDGTITTLYTVDPLVPSSTVIADLTGVPGGIWLAASPGGTLYTLDILGDSLFTVDKTNGATTGIGYVGFDANYAQGADFDDVTGTLYMATIENTPPPQYSRLYSVDTLTGIASMIDTLTDNVDGLTCLPYNPSSTDYSYSWTPSTGLSATDVSNPTANPAATTTYTVTATDACGTTTTSITILTVSNIALAYTVTDVSVIGGNDGALEVLPTGGDAPYTFLWSTGATTDTTLNLVAGIYTVTVTDANGCSLTDTVTVNQPPSSVTEIAGAGFTSLSLSPNPSDGLIMLNASLNEKSAVEIKIMTAGGKLVESVQVPAGTRLSETFNLGKHGNGMYFIQLKTAKGIYNQRILIQ